MTYLCHGTNPLAKARGASEHILPLAFTNWLCRFLFVDFRNADDANLALAALHNHPFDAKHTFKINHFTDIERFADLDETYVEPELEEYSARACFYTSSYFRYLTKFYRSIFVPGWPILKDVINM
jgi:hypothetical protein